MIQINAQDGAVVNVTDKPINNILVMGDMVQTKTVALAPTAGQSKEDESQTHTEVNETDETLSPLLSREAMRLWKIAQLHRWVDANLQPMISYNKAAILASVMADELKLSPRWKYFEELWNIPDLASKLAKAQYSKYYPDTVKEYERAMTS